MQINLPHDVELEMSVLGSALAYADPCYPVIAGIIEPGDFYFTGYSDVFQIIGEMWNAGHVPDSVIVTQELRRRGLLERVGGQSAILACVASPTSTEAGAEHKARKMLELAQRRRLITQAMELAQRAAIAGDPIDDLLTRWRIAGDGVAQRGVNDNDIESLDDLAQIEQQRLDELYRNGGAYATHGITTGFGWLDDASGGYQPGDLWFWAGRPNTGKTRLLIYSLGMAARAGHNVGIISLDMSKPRLLKYLIPQLANVNGQNVHPADFYRPIAWGDLESARVYSASRAVDPDRRMWIVADPRGNRISNIESYVRQLRRKHGCKVIAVDQYQNIGGWGRAANERGLYATIVGGLKRLARQHGVCIIALHQIQRAGASAPTMANLKDTGCIEEYSDAGIIIHDVQRALVEEYGGFVREGAGYRPPKDGKDKEEEICRTVELTREIRIALEKNRNEAVTREHVRFNFSTGTKA